MPTVAFTGPHTLTEPRWRGAVWHIATALEQLQSRAPQEAFTFRTGGAHGVDSIALQVTTERYPWARHEVYVPGEGQLWHNDELVRIVTATIPTVRVIPVPGGYLDRNTALICGLHGDDPADHLLALPRTATEELRSGTWSTVRRARRAGITVDIRPLT